ncbi:hypothetical protein ASG72_04760 [Bosea sp. Leaf344]|uniref:hypothetical protein n=1 Tax=Bosea sp. Leaf344 TaxID=1736346 RepID=UPI0006FCB9DF|nr:hypothetical protein [Bosea sp. Leaf344]KQU54920.1 hypothetical protein ASG72_04760 [Bosea sp. Leaf344]
MLNDSLAPIKRGLAFFGVMGAAVAALTFGADLQIPTDQSSTTVAQAKLERKVPTDVRFAAVDPAQRSVGATKRAIAGPQQALNQTSTAAAILR